VRRATATSRQQHKTDGRGGQPAHPSSFRPNSWVGRRHGAAGSVGLDGQLDADRGQHGPQAVNEYQEHADVAPPGDIDASGVEVGPPIATSIGAPRSG